MPARQQCYGTHGSEVDGHVLAVRVADYHTVTTSSMPSSLSNSLQVSPRLGSGSNLAEGSRPNTTNLIVSSLPRAVDETYLILLFACFGKIIRAKVVRDDTTGISKGTGFVYFENASDAEMARTQMNGYMLEGHMLKVDLAGPPPVTRFSHTSTPVESIKPHKKIDDANIFIRCMPEDVDENYLTLLFSPYGKIIGINLMKDQSGHRNGYGFISFGNASDAAMAITHMNGFKIKGHSLEVRAAGFSLMTVPSSIPPKSNLLQGSFGLPLGAPITHINTSKEIDPANLYVAYLPLAADENFLMQLFSCFGKIVSVRVARDHITVSKCYGFVSFESAANAAEAMTYMNGYIFEGHMLAVRVAGLNPYVLPQNYCPTEAPQSNTSGTAES